jgi:transposase
LAVASRNYIKIRYMTGRYFRLLVIGYFEGLDSERVIACRTVDSFSLGNF